MTYPFVAHLDGTGTCVAGRAFLGQNATLYGIASDRAGNVFTVGGLINGSIDFGGGALGSRGFVIAKLDPSLGYVWGKVFANTNQQAQGGATAVAVDDAGTITFAGAISTPGDAGVDFGGGPVFVQPGGPFLARLDSAGSYLAASAWSAKNGGGVRAVAVAPWPDAYIYGSFFNTLDLGQGPMVKPASALNDSFLARESP